MDFHVALTLPTGFSLNAALKVKAQTQVLGLTGPSGAGKSTLLNILANLHHADRRRVNWSIRGSRIGLVFQDALLFPHLNVSENLAMAEHYAQTPSDTNAIIDGCVCRHLLHREVESLSGGERQRVALARALINSPDVLLTDEAFSAMDQQLALQVQYFVKRFCVSHSIFLLMVSHDVKSLALLCDEVALMREGEIVAVGQPERVLFQRDHTGFSQGVPFAVLRGPLTEAEAPAGLRVLHCEGQPVYCRHPLTDNGIGKVTVDAQDVSIDLSHHHQSSILNAFECEIRAIESANESQVLLTLERANTTLYALISSLSVHRLNLVEGMTVTARFKLR